MTTVIYYNRASGEIFVCNTETEDQFRRQAESNLNLRMFDRLVLKDYDPKSQDFLFIQPKSDGTQNTQVIENTERVTFPVVLSMVRSVVKQCLGT